MLLQRKSGPARRRQCLRTPTRHLVRTIVGHTDWVRYVVPSDDGRLLASASKDQVLCFSSPFRFSALLKIHGRLLDFGTLLRANKRWSFGGTTTKSKLWFLLRLHRTMPFASLRAFRFVCSRGGQRIYLTLRSEHGSSEEARRLCCYGLERQDSQTLGHTKWSDAEKPCGCLSALHGNAVDAFSQAGHDNWVRALIFHPSGKLLLSASDDKTIRIWEVSTGRCMKTVEAHTHFVATIAWGRQKVSVSLGKTNGVEGAESRSGEPEKLVNVVASAGVDQMVKIWLP